MLFFAEATKLRMGRADFAIESDLLLQRYGKCAVLHFVTQCNQMCYQFVNRIVNSDRSMSQTFL